MENGVDPTSVSPKVKIGANERNGIQCYLSKDGIINRNGNLKTWEELLNPTGQAATKRNKSLIIYGMALHSVTDMFAHSTRERVGQTNTYAVIHHPEADYTHYVEERWNAAKTMAQRVIAHIKAAEAGNVNDYYYVIKDFSSNPSFKIVNLSDCVKEVDSAHYNSRYQKYDNASLSVK